MYWVGMSTTAADATALAEFNDFYSNTHLPEVVAQNAGFARATRYELIDPDPRGGIAPGWLAAYEIDSEAAARTYIDRSDGSADARPKYTHGPAVFKSADHVWR